MWKIRWFSVLVYVKINSFFCECFQFWIFFFWHKLCTLVCPVCTCIYLSRIMLVITHTWIMNFSVLVFWALCFLYPEFCLPWPGMVYCLDFLPEWVRGSHQLLPHWLQGSFLVSFTNIGFFSIGLERLMRMHGLIKRVCLLCM